MLEAFNSGSLVRYQQLCTLHKISVDAELALVENEKKLVEKINILRLIDFFFMFPRISFTRFGLYIGEKL
ncbi:putative 26S Proteasome non-ATPase regulatory subunit 13 [Helianthus anomalus]